MFSGLRATGKHAREMAEHPSQTEAEKTLWSQIADEIDAYIAGDGSEQAELF